MIYVLYGRDDYARREYLVELKKGLGDEEFLATNTTQLDGQHLTVNQLREVCDTLPFWGEKRLVMVEGLLARFEPRARPARGGGAGPEVPAEQEAKAFADYLKQMPQNTVLVIMDSELGKNGQSRKNVLLNALTPLATVKRFDPAKGPELQAWVRGEVEKRGAKISPQAAALLVETAGDNRWTLTGEIEKLTLFAAGEIRDEDVRQVVSSAKEITIFNLVDDILGKNSGRAQQRLAKLFKEGMAASHILTMITREARSVLLTKEMLTSRTPHAEIQSHLGIPQSQGWRLQKTLKLAQSYHASQLEGLYGSILDADLMIKTGRASEELALTLLVAGLSRPQAGSLLQVC